jgi:primosomal protein N' (replication factor Y) (superfamily II helicase)
MRYYEVAPLQIVRSDSSTFTYASNEQIQPGQIVFIEVGKKNMTGLVMQEVKKPTYSTKEISGLMALKPIPLPLLHLASWLSEYYVTHLATVLHTLLPRGLQKKRRQRTISPHIPLRDRTKIVFNKEQSAAIQQIETSPSGTLLLHGITGSGKTAVYIELAKRTLESNQSVIVLVPEISLTPQLVDEFTSHFSNVILTHSRQTESERHYAWTQALDSEQPMVIIGPRSALFMPISNIGLIVIDEAHEPSFKQEQSPRYSALRAAGVLAKAHKAKLILGSATPLVSDYYVASESGRPIIEMKTTARKSIAPDITLVDMTDRGHFNRHRFLSDQLLGKLEETFNAGQQALIFHNRRGSAHVTLCENCGWQATCERCFIPMTLHTDQHLLRCHVCGNTDKVPTSCPVCADANIIHKGIGTKLVESELRKIFSKITIARFDGDSPDDATVESRYKDLYSGSIDLIIGTQVVAKGLDLPHLRTVGVIQADAGLSLPDYSSPERTFQLLAQVVGRVGRNEHATNVVVQSYQPTHPSVVDGLAQNYADFYETTIAERKRANFPPFTFIMKLVCIYKTEAASIKNSSELKQKLRQQLPNTVEILGPTPAFYERQRDTYRWQIVLKSKKRSDLVSALQHLPPTHWQFEIDPTTLL